MKIADIVNTAAHFNAQHNYDVPSALKLTEIVIRQAHTVQLARIQAADPQLVLPIDIGEAQP